MKISRQMRDNTLVITDENAAEILTLQETLDGDVLKIKACGSIYGPVSLEFEDELESAISAKYSVYVDLSDVTMIASEVLYVLLRLQHIVEASEGLEFILENPQREVMSILHETGYDQLIEIR